MAKARILLASEYTGSANSIIPVAKKLIQDDKIEPILVANGPAKDSFKMENLDFRNIEDYGLDKVDYGMVKRILDKECPNLVVTGSSAGVCLEKGLILAARNRRIKSISVLDNPGNYKIRVKNDVTGDDYGCMPDIYTALDSNTLEDMVKEGLPREKLVVTGNPYFDDLGQLRDSLTQDEKEKIKSYFATKPNEPMITFISQPLKADIAAGKSTDWGYNEEVIFEMFSKSLKEINYTGNLVFKFHPRESLDEVSHRLRARIMNGLVTIISGKESFTLKQLNNVYNIRETMLASDLTVGMMSTSLTEGCILDRNVLSIQVGLKSPDSLKTNSDGYSVAVYKEEDIAESVYKLLYDSDFKNKLKVNRKSLIEKYDGKATERVVDLIYENLRL